MGGELFTDSIGASDRTPVAPCIGGGAHAAAIRAQLAALDEHRVGEASITDPMQSIHEGVV